MSKFRSFLLLNFLLGLLLLLLFSGVADAITENITNASYVLSAEPDSNYNTQEYLSVGNVSGLIFQTYIELPNNNSNIILHLYNLYAAGFTDTNISVHNTNIFDESTLTWNNKPAILNYVGSFIVPSGSSSIGWYNVTLTSPYKYVVLLTLSDDVGADKAFATDESVLYPPYITSDTFDPSGYVKNINGTSLTGVNITYGNTTVWSNTTGWYDFGDSFANGTYSYSVKHGFYVTQTGNITVAQGGSIVNYTLVHKCSGICDVYAAKNGSDTITELVNGTFVENINPDTNYADTLWYVGDNGSGLIDETYIELPSNRSTEGLNLYLYNVAGAPFNISINNTLEFNESNITWNNKPAKGSFVTSFTVNLTGWYSILLPNPYKYLVLSASAVSDTTFRSDDSAGDRPYISANSCLSWTSACLNISRAVNLSQEYGTVHIGYGNYSNQTKINGTKSLRYFCDVAGYNETGFGSKCRFPPFGR